MASERQKQSANLSNHFADLLAQPGLRPRQTHQKTANGRGACRASNALSFHSLRHTATSLMHEAGVPDAVVLAMIGHDSEAMHQHYIGVGQEAMKAAANSLPQLTAD